MRSRTISVTLGSSSEICYAGQLFQYDHGMVLSVAGLTINALNPPQFQFSNDGQKTAYTSVPTVDGDNYLVQIPDVILMFPKDFVCYVYQEGTNADPYGITTYVIRFKVVPRQKPMAGEYTPDQIANYDILVGQAVAEKGYMDFYIDEDGHLIYRATQNIYVDFELEDGRLIAIWPTTT